jgi:aprataxin
MSKKVVQRTLDTFISKKRDHSTSSNESDTSERSNKKSKPLTKINHGTQKAKTPIKQTATHKPSFLSLESVINDPKCQIYKDDHCICIKDKFAKSKQHYLLIPFDEHQKRFSQLIDFKKENIKLLEHLKSVANNLIEKEFEIKTVESYKLGFHSVQSMFPLHMHIITRDFVSDSLKTKKHWNSFNTRYFINLEEIIEHLKDHESLEDLLLAKDELEKLLKSDLKCNQCPKVLSNMPKLKEHLRIHQK